MAAILNVINENPEKKPLEDLYFPIKDNGVITKIPALSKHWIEPTTYINYKPLPIIDGKIIETLVEFDEWIAQTELFEQQTRWLLQMEHYRFWSYMVYDTGCIACVSSFLQEATPFFLPITTLTTNHRIVTLYTKCLDNVLKILFRLIVQIESSTEWISPDHLPKLIYPNFLISIPIVFDVLMAYGRTNIALLQRLVTQIFAIEPRYRDDLKVALNYLKHSFQHIQEKVNENDSKTNFDDLAVYSLDCAATIGVLLDVYPEAVELALDIHMEQCITNFYDLTLPLLYKQICVVNPVTQSLKLLNQSRMEILGAFRNMSNFHLERILGNPMESILPAEQFLAILQEALSDPVFVIDYKRMYPVLNDIDILQQACTDLDGFKVDFIVRAYTSSDEQFMTTSTYPPQAKKERVKSDDEEEGAAAWPLPSTSGGSLANKEIQNVLDVLPHLRPDVVEELLKRYESTELAIADVLEGNLPPDLQALQNNPSSSKQSIDVPKETEKTTNKFKDFGFGDDDSVIIKRNKGFPGQPKTLSKMLDDKSHVRSLKTRYQEYGYVSENEYDDEYDDSYDALTETEAKRNLKVKSFIVNELQDDAEDDDESDENEEILARVNGQDASATNNASGESSYRDKAKDFCENPELMRERRAQNWNNKMSSRAPKKVPKPSADVVGKPKGQGQDTATQHSRQKKEAHKSSKANHNRRQGASWKRTTGMIPS